MCERDAAVHRSITPPWASSCTTREGHPRRSGSGLSSIFGVARFSFTGSMAAWLAAMAARGILALGSALRVPPLAALSLTGGSERARAQLSLHWNGLAWLINPFSGLVPDVDRSQ